MATPAMALAKVDAQKRIIPQGDPRKAHWWRLTLGRKITGGGKKRKFFRTEREAKAYFVAIVKRAEEEGHQAFEIPYKLRLEAMKCEELLQPHGVSLTDAVSYYLRHARPGQTTKTFDEVREEFLESRRFMKGCRSGTIKEYRSQLSGICEEYGTVRLGDVRQQDVEDWLQEQVWAPRTRKNYLTTLGTIYGWAQGRGYCSEDPVRHIERPILDDKPPGILSVAQVEALLQAALENDPGLLPAILVGLFAGLRRSEVSALTWEEVRLDTGLIEVKGIKAKTRQRRLVTISPNLREVLAPYALYLSGPVGPGSPDVFGERLRALAQAAKIVPWPHNAIRHSFASYLYAQTQNEVITAAQMGNTPNVVMRHYRELVRPQEAKRFWTLRPLARVPLPDLPSSGHPPGTIQAPAKKSASSKKSR